MCMGSERLRSENDIGLGASLVGETVVSGMLADWMRRYLLQLLVWSHILPNYSVL